MGMLFNTDATLQILQKANTVFNRDGLQQIKQDGGWDAIAGALAPGSKKIFDTLAKPLGIEFDPPNTKHPSRKAKRWKKYCDFLDAKTDTDSSHGGVTLAQRIGTGIYGAITADGGAKYAAVEFFAAPATEANVVNTVSIVDFPTDDETTLVITVYTHPADKAFAALDAALANNPNLTTF